MRGVVTIKKIIIAAVVVIVLIAGGGYFESTESARVEAGTEALAAKAAAMAEQAVAQVKPIAVVTLDQKCPTGTRSTTRELPVDGIDAGTVIGMVGTGCQIAGSRAELKVEAPRDAEGPIQGEGFRDGQGKMTVTTTGAKVTVQVTATAKAGLTGKEITATARSEFSGEGVQQKLAEKVKDASVKAAPVIAEKVNPSKPVNEVVLKETPAPAPTTTQPQPTAPVTPPAPSQLISQDKLNRFGSAPATVSPSESAKKINEPRKRSGWSSRRGTACM